MKKVAMITGATAGIGKATAELFVKGGYTVYALARSAKDGDGVFGIPTDVTDKAQLEAAFKTVFEREGRIDVLVNSAGFGISGSVEDTTEELARSIFDVNFFGTLNACQTVVPYMRETGGGTIINVSSVAAKLALPFQAMYSATKAAVSSLTEALRAEVKPFNIKVTSILPGDVASEFTARRQKNAGANPAYGERIARSVSKMEHDELSGMSPLTIAKQIVKLSKRKNPPAAVIGGKAYAVLVFLSRILPQRLVLFVLSKMYAK